MDLDLHRAGAFARLAVCAITTGLTVLAGCTSGGSAVRHELAPSPTPGFTMELRYGPLQGDFDLCAEARAHEIPANFGLKVPSLEFRGHHEEYPSNILGPRRWSANCRFEASTDHGEALFRVRGYVGVIVYRDQTGVATPPARHVDARVRYYDQIDYYVRYFDELNERESPSVEPVAGWWDEGSVVEIREDHQYLGDTILNLAYLVYHDNLFVDLSLVVNIWADQAAESVPRAHELARALIEQVYAEVPLAGG